MPPPCQEGDDGNQLLDQHRLTTQQVDQEGPTEQRVFENLLHLRKVGFTLLPGRAVVVHEVRGVAKAATHVAALREQQEAICGELREIEAMGFRG